MDVQGITTSIFIGTIVIFLLSIYINGLILKYFIRQAIKEAFVEMGLNKKPIDEEWNE